MAVCEAVVVVVLASLLVENNKQGMVKLIYPVCYTYIAYSLFMEL